MKDIETLVIGYLDGSLNDADRALIEAKLSDPAVAQLIAEHRALNRLTHAVASEQHSAAAGFSNKVVQQIERKRSPIKRRFDMVIEKTRRYQAGLAIVAAACVTMTVASNMKVEELSSFTTAQQTPSENKVPSSPTTPAITAVEPLERIEPASQSNTAKTEPAVGKESPKKKAMVDESAYDDSLVVTDPIQTIVAATVSGAAEKIVALKEKAEAISPRTRDLAGASERKALHPAPGLEADLAIGEGYRGLIEQPYRHPTVDYHIPAQQREGYNSYAENPRVMVATEPRSTFSIDVDTGSYTNARRFLAMGQLPPADAVRIEEFINYFDYSYPDQARDPFAVHYEIAPSPLEPERFLLKVGIKAKAVADSEKPRNLVFLIDTSGSMAEELPLVQQSLGVLTDNLRSTDRVAIVTYAGGAGVVLESTAGSEKEKIRQAINQLTSGGSTYGSGGITLAYEIAQKHLIQDGVNRVVLTTDGDFNVGVTNFDELVRLIETKRKSGVSLTSVGVGSGNYQEKNLEQLANKGNGNYFYLDSFKEARKVFATQLGATLETVAKDVKLQIEFNPAHVLEYRLVGYDNRRLKNEDFANDQIDAGEIGAGHTVTAFYELVLADSTLATKLKNELRYQANKQPTAVVESDSKELAFLQIRFKQPNGDVSDLRTFPLLKSEVRSSAAAASEEFRFAAAVTYFATKLRNSQFAGTYSYEDILALAKSSKGEDSQGLRQEFIGLVENVKAMGK